MATNIGLNQNYIPVFDGENYDFWCVKMRTLFISLDLWSTVQDGYEEPESSETLTQAQVKENQQKDASALAKIQQAVSDAIFPRIIGATKAKEAWEILQQEFRGNTGPTTIQQDEDLRRAAQEGNVDELYASIQRDRHVLRHIDEMEFVDTPLHVAAAKGCIDFAMEMMNLKPSFARKLNQQGLSPIHLAIEKGHKELAVLLVENDKDLVRVKGKKGETPLHYAITREHNLDLLPKLLDACPECIRDVTTRNETALHIATRSNELEALKLLCRVLKKTDYRWDVMNKKDMNSDTALHIAARHNQREILKLLLKCNIDKHAINQAGSTALDVARQLNNRESVTVLRSCFNSRVSTIIYKVQKRFLKYVTYASTLIFRDMDNISSDERNALLVVLGLLLTTTFQASLSPPGSVWQGDSSSNSTVTQGKDQKTLGKSVMDQNSFLLFYIPTSTVFVVTFFLTLGLLKPFPRGFRTALQMLLAFLAICFYESIFFLAPTYLATKVIGLFSFLVFVLMMFMCLAYRVSKLSVLILGCWLLGLSDIPIMVVILGYLFFYLRDEFWK